MIFVGNHAQAKWKMASWRATPPHQKIKLQRSVYHKHKLNEELSEKAHIHYKQV